MILGRRYSVTVEDMSLAASADDTLIQVNPHATRPLRLVEFSVSFNGVSAGDAAIEVLLERQTTVGSGGAAQTPKLLDPNDSAAGFTARVGDTTSGTAGDLLKKFHVTPNGGLLVMKEDLDIVAVGAGNRLALRAVAPGSMTTVLAQAYMILEEF